MDIYELLIQDHQKAAQLFDKLDGAEGREREKIYAQLADELTMHASVEESIVYPALEDADETRDLVREALDEHEEMKQLVEELQVMDKDDPDWEDKLRALRNTVEHHVEEEETELFPLARDVLSEDEAEGLVEAIEDHKEQVRQQLSGS